MFTRRDLRNRTIAIEVLGFTLVGLVIWGNELFDLPHHLFGAPASPTRIWEALMESVVLLVVAVGVIRTTTTLFRRLAESAADLPTCSTCQRVHYRGEWLEFREYLEETADTRATYGMCPVCTREVRSLIAHPLPPTAVPQDRRGP